MSPANEPRLSKAEKTAQAREKARAIREEQLKKEKRNKLLVGWGGIVVAVVVIIALVAFVVIGNAQNNAPVADQGPTPANGNVHGGITLLANTEVVKSEPASVNVADVPAPLATKPATVTVPGGEAEAGKPVKVVATSTSSARSASSSRPLTASHSRTFATKARFPSSTAPSASWTASPPPTTRHAQPTLLPA